MTRPEPKHGQWGRAECGTQSGYSLHVARMAAAKRDGDQDWQAWAPCEPCKRAHSLTTLLSNRAARNVAARHPEERELERKRLMDDHAAQFAAIREAARGGDGDA